MNKKLYLLFIVFAQINYPMQRSKSYDDLYEKGGKSSPKAIDISYCNIPKPVTHETQTDRRRRISLNQEQANRLRIGLLSVCAGLVRNNSFESQVMTVSFKDSDSSK